MWVYQADAIAGLYSCGAIKTPPASRPTPNRLTRTI